MSFRNKVQKFHEFAHRVEGEVASASITDFKNKKNEYNRSQMQGALRDLKNHDLKEIEDEALITQIREKLNEITPDSDISELQAAAKELIDLEKSIQYSPSSQSISFQIRNLPQDIIDEMSADVKELERCFDAQCFRASVIVCGRILETALHRVYYEKTGNDLLEKSPGIGLGTLIAKMKERDIAIDPALSQQIHLINQVRIFSVHKKQQVFSPSKDQTHAIILYTLDVVRKLFA